MLFKAGNLVRLLDFSDLGSFRLTRTKAAKIKKFSPTELVLHARVPQLGNRKFLRLCFYCAGARSMHRGGRERAVVQSSAKASSC